MLHPQQSANRASILSFVAIPQDFILCSWRSAKKKSFIFRRDDLTFQASPLAPYQEGIVFFSWHKVLRPGKHFMSLLAQGLKFAITLFFYWRDASRHQIHFYYTVDSALELHTSFSALPIKHFFLLTRNIKTSCSALGTMPKKVLIFLWCDASILHASYLVPYQISHLHYLMK